MLLSMSTITPDLPAAGAAASTGGGWLGDTGYTSSTVVNVNFSGGTIVGDTTTTGFRVGAGARAWATADLLLFSSSSCLLYLT